MKVKLDVVIKDLSGVAFKHQRVDSVGQQITGELTAKDVIIACLLNAVEPGRQESGEEKFKRYQIAQRVTASNGEAELTTEEVALIKRLCAVAYMPAIVGRLYDVVEGKAE